MDIPIHPDDLLFFNEVATAMRLVAKQYDLSLRSITGFTMPSNGMADRQGDCSATGNIRLVMRCSDNGQWCEHPCSPELVWDTAAHELAHLRHFNHGKAFEEFWAELREALQNRQVDHKDKVLKRLVKLQNSREGEKAIGNAAAAEAFASMINKMLIDYELSPSDVDYARAMDNDPVIEMRVNLGTYKIRTQKARIAWQESLARIVAQAHLCTFLLRPKSNDIWFVGTKSHATVAEYVYGTLVPIVDKLSDKEYYDFLARCQREDGVGTRAHGFRPAWLSSFVGRIAERFGEARKAVVAEAPIGASTALVRLSGSLVKVQKYIDNKFAGRKSSVGAIGIHHKWHRDGMTAGRAAADKMVIGRKGVSGGATRGQIGGGE